MKKSFKQTQLSTLFISSLFLGANAMAADYKQNPFTLTYDGAITENVQGKVNIQPVKYQLNGLTIAANVYTPANFDPSKKYPAIVVAHPNGGVKEQVAGLYAQKSAEQGYVTIAFDAAYQGASGGKPRYVDKPASRDNLSAVNRELVTVSTLASLETVQNQLRSHLGILKNLGLNETELKRVIDKIRQQNPTAADKANEVLKEVFKKQ